MGDKNLKVGKIGKNGKFVKQGGQFKFSKNLKKFAIFRARKTVYRKQFFKSDKLVTVYSFKARV